MVKKTKNCVRKLLYPDPIWCLSVVLNLIFIKHMNQALYIIKHRRYT